MATKKLTMFAVIAAAAASFSLTACNGDDTAGAASSSSADSSSSASTGGSDVQSKNDSGVDSGGQSGDDGSNSTTTGGSGSDFDHQGDDGQNPLCQAEDLTLAAPHRISEDAIVFTVNNAGDTCVLNGFPEVDVKGKQATNALSTVSSLHSKVEAGPVAVGSGESAHFVLHHRQIKPGDKVYDYTSVVVTLPNSGGSLSDKANISLPASGDDSPETTVDPFVPGEDE